MFHIPTCSGVGVPVSIGQQLPDFDHTGVETDARLEVEAIYHMSGGYGNLFQSTFSLRRDMIRMRRALT